MLVGVLVATSVAAVQAFLSVTLRANQLVVGIGFNILALGATTFLYREIFGPLSRDTKTGRAGVAGFTVPNAPVGSRVASDPDNPGWAGLGFAIEWGRPERVD